MFSKLPPPKNAGYEPPSASAQEKNPTASSKPLTVKKSGPLIPHAVAKKQQAAKKGSDDEDDDTAGGGCFFTIDEPELKEVHIHEPVPEVTTYAQPQITESYISMPTNQEYNLAGIPDSFIMERQQAAQLELDAAAVSLPKIIPVSYTVMPSSYHFFHFSIAASAAGLIGNETEVTG